MKRVVVTGMAGITALGDDWDAIDKALRARKNGVRYMPEWDYIQALNTRIAAPVDYFVTPEHYPRKVVRGVGRVAMLSVRASELALIDANLLNDPAITNGQMGVAYGSSSGSVDPVRVFAHMLETGSMENVTSTSYIQMMPHTAAVNIALFFGLKGRIIPTSSACTSGSQGIGYAYEAIRFGRQTMMLAGGAEEMSAPSSAVFDTLFATSSQNDTPALTPRPFDQKRDGLVVGEGAATLVLEEYEHAKARGAKIYAEIIGFACNSDGRHVTQPAMETMAVAMQMALDDANIPSQAVGYVSAHGTATDRGDVAETQATEAVFNRPVPISSMKSYLGHTLGACGAIEAWWGIEMMRRHWFAPTLNLENVDAACGQLGYITGAGSALDIEYMMSNNFAFGGINTSLIFKRMT
ncbi:beta-ketoacyl-ACP synthase [Methylotenera sp. 1P/1]|uniref:beta-ketoacyl-ACP synthase n=1 Tax=Methylotenera sp. 1P/1 TaxID=1131551 RepID=UPI0003688DF6|nr:beta-ketoacyl-ACP synthase [Methylotenera sp. 1P/1]